ncbi:hypothetical protein [Yoonia sp. 208BN28-4]|uniref:hypothetical protein n=1 Tax=Yoonia sp. 208BN28-4 TaxID=3126505 RepID=UPI0030ABB92F
MIQTFVTLALTAAALPAAALACDRAPLQVVDMADKPITLTIDPACLTDPTDTGVIMADLAIQLTEAHLAADTRADFTAVREVIVETFVSEILEPTLSAN